MGILCSDTINKRKTQEKKKALEKMTKQNISKKELELNLLEKEIIDMKKELQNMQTTPELVSNEKINNFKRDIVDKINKYHRLGKEIRFYKNNVQVIDEKGNQKELADNAKEINEYIQSIDNEANFGNIGENIQIVQEEKVNQEMFNNILEEGDNKYQGMDKYKMDEIINGFS